MKQGMKEKVEEMMLDSTKMSLGEAKMGDFCERFGRAIVEKKKNLDCALKI